MKFADGSDKRVMRNRYAVLYNNAMEELIQKDLKGNGVLFARSVTVRVRMALAFCGGAITSRASARRMDCRRW